MLILFSRFRLEWIMVEILFRSRTWPSAARSLSSQVHTAAPARSMRAIAIFSKGKRHSIRRYSIRERERRWWGCTAETVALVYRMLVYVCAERGLHGVGFGNRRCILSISFIADSSSWKSDWAQVRNASSCLGLLLPNMIASTKGRWRMNLIDSSKRETPSVSARLCKDGSGKHTSHNQRWKESSMRCK